MIRKIMTWLGWVALVLVVLWLAFVWAGQAWATSPLRCAPNERITKDLDRLYGEQPIAMGLHANGMVMQVFASQQNRTWTIVLTQPNGLSCLIGSGHSFERMPWMAKEWQS